MQLSQQAVSDLKEIYFKEFSKKLSDKEANEKGLVLLEFFKLIYMPIPKICLKNRKKGGEKLCL